jgi:hypothetical protein
MITHTKCLMCYHMSPYLFLSHMKGIKQCHVSVVHNFYITLTHVYVRGAMMSVLLYDCVSTFKSSGRALWRCLFKQHSVRGPLSFWQIGGIEPLGTSYLRARRCIRSVSISCEGTPTSACGGHTLLSSSRFTFFLLQIISRPWNGRHFKN